MFRIEIIERETDERIAIIKVSGNQSVKTAVQNAARNLGYLPRDIGYNVLGYRSV